MSDNRLTITFLPWVQRGLVTAASALADSSGLPTSDIVRVGATLQIDGVSEPAGATFRLRGPADASRLAAGQILRTDPVDQEAEAEPHLFPFVEFADGELPWLLTPATTPGNRLAPWLVVVVVPADECRLAASTYDRLPVLTAPVAHLPSLEESHAWAHVQVDTDAAKATNALDGSPELVRSRLMCPRHLAPSTSYVAALVPAFRGGVDAGLGLLADDATIADPAWDPTQSEVQLPVYHSWTFTTAAGPISFEALAHRLVPVPAPAATGTHPLDVSQPGIGLPGNTRPSSISYRGALVAPGSEDGPPVGKALSAALRSQVNVPGASEAGEQYDQLVDDPVVTAPLYGGRHAGRTTVGALGDAPLWLGQLNLAPQQRAVAGLAVEAVRRDQEAIMAEAWTQAAGIRSVNGYLTSANAAAAFGARWERRLVSIEAGVADDTLLRITASAHGRLSAGENKTVAGVLTGHADFARAAFTPTLTRISHLRGRAQRLGLVSRGAAPLASQIASSLFANTGRYANVALRAAPAGSSLADEAWLERMTAAISGRPVVTTPVHSPYPIGLHGLEPVVASGVFEGLSGAASAVLEHKGTGEPAWVGLADAVQVTSGLATALAGGATRAGHLEGRLTKEARRSLGALAADAGEMAKRSAELLDRMPASGSVSARQRTQVTRFVEQAHQLNELATQVWDMFEVGSGMVPAPHPRDPGELLALGTKVRQAIDVVATVVSAVKQRVTPEPVVGVDRLPPPALTAHPAFALPGYQRMLDVGIEYLCPGIDQIGTDAVSVLETNQPTIESFLVGLNYELAREFLWREYPVVLTDTWMTRFWSLAGGGEEEIEPIAEWGPRRELGAGGPDAQAVVFIRGELLVRYPTALVYLLPGIVTGSGPSAVISPDYLQPMPPTFVATLGRGARAYGFPLATADLAAHLDNKDGGYFVVIEEQPGDPRFGLDDADSSQFTQDPAVLASWDSLGWGHLVSNQTELDALSHARLDGVRVAGLEIEEDAWGDDAAAMARIALRRPHRIIAHAETLLP